MSQPLRALIVEDSEDDALLLVAELRRGGFEPVFKRVASPETMNAALAAQKWDIVFADYTMPRFKGTDALELLRRSGMDLPFIFVSGTIGEETAVKAMKAGAHDYIIKGNTKRLLPAVERELHEAEERRERRAVEENLRREQERTRALHEINLAISSTLELGTVLGILLEKTDLFLSAPGVGTIILSDRDGGDLELVACRNLDEETWRSEGWQAGRELDRSVIEGGSALLVENLQEDPRTRGCALFREHDLVSYLGVPLVAKGNALGVFSLYFKSGHRLNSEEMEFLIALGGPAAIAIHNAQLYERTRKQAEGLEEANRLKSEFLGVMSHELKTPLNVVMGYAGMIRDKLLADHERAVAKIVHYSTDLLVTIDSMLDANRLEAGAMSVQRQAFSLNRFFEELKWFYEAPGETSVALVWDLPAEACTIRTDNVKLRHILQNLINNALKFTEKGAVTVSARIINKAVSNQPLAASDLSLQNSSLKTADSMPRAEFKVSDTGIGIPKEKIPVIFDMFRQVDGSSQNARRGVGLGLYIVKSFVGMVGGTISVESELGKGSTFTVAIPLQD